ncbi:MAG: M28 family peptidase [Thermofilaceae archaeon]
MSIRKAPSLLLIFLLVVSTLTLPAYLVGAQPSSIPISELVGLVKLDEILQHTKYFSNLDSRVTGYDGFYQAAEYIKEYWSGLGFTVREEPFDVAIPIVKDASISVDVPGAGLVKYSAYPLWPNHVNPCPYVSPVSGDKLVYAGKGGLEDFDGVDVEGAFVLVEFNNRWYWKYAAMFKAKGVIFIEPDDTSVTEALQKVLSVPVNFPRLFVSKNVGAELKELLKKHSELKVWVNSEVEWERRRVANIIATIEGTNPDLKDEVAVVGAYYDSWSITPQLSPGATDAIGISFLLELSRLLKERPARRTVWLVAFAGHYQALAGAREFVDSHFGELGSKVKMMITLDLASDSDVVAAYAAGAMYGYNRPRDILPQYDSWMNSIVSLARNIENITGEPARLIDGVRWTWPPWAVSSPPFEPFLRYFEAEVFTKACYGGGLAFVTTNALRKYQWTFMDTFEKLRLENLRRQLIVLAPVIYHSLDMERIPYSLYPRRIGAVDHGLVSVTLQLGKYNKTTNMFDDYAHKDALIFVSVSPIMSGAAGILAVGFQPAAAVGSSQSITVQGATVGLFAASSPVSGTTVTAASINTPVGFTLILKPDETGRVELKSIMPLTAVDAQAYVVDSRTGEVLSATDTGPFGTGVFRLGGLFGAAGAIAAPLLSPMMGGLGYLAEAGAYARAFTVQVPRGHRYIPLFNCSSIVFIGFYDPLLLYGPQGLSFEPLSFISHSYLVWRDVLTTWPEAMAFVEPEVPVEVLIRSQGRVIAVLNNASEANPNGQGYTLPWGKTLVLTAVDAVLNTYRLAEYRGGFLESRMTSSPRMLLYLDTMRKYLVAAKSALDKGSKSIFVKYVLAAWQFVIGSYDSTISLLFDVSQTAVFFFFLSIAFALLASRFMGRMVSGKKQTLYTLVVLITANAAVAFVHPGYTISNNVWMLVSGVSVILFLALVLYTVSDEFNTAISELSTSILGFHRADVRRGSILPSAISMGIENLKKRPLRTALTLTTITITVMALVLFTTVNVSLFFYNRNLGPAPYTGVLVRRPFQQLYMPMHEIYLKILPGMLSNSNALFEAHPRAWLYPAGQSLFLTWGPNGSGIRCMLALTPEESKSLERALDGYYFTPASTYSVIMTKSLAERLSAILGYPVGLGSEINIYGINMTVVGLLDKQIASAVLARDLDGSPITPPDPIATGLAATYSPLDLDTVIIIPYSFALQYLNAQPNVMRVSTESRIDKEYMLAKAYEIATFLPFDISYGVKDDTAQLIAKRDIYAMGGFENVAVPLVLSALTMLITMLGAVYERRREIHTLATVGAAPGHIDIIFVMEGATLAFLGAYLGYIVGASALFAVWNLRAFPPGLVPNVSSGVVIVVIGVIMITVILSTLYPASRASRLATPSLLRSWAIETKPRAGSWQVRMPFMATRDEAIGLLVFISEYLEAYSSERERSRVFMLLSPPQLGKDDKGYTLSARLHMAPFDAGIIQDMNIFARITQADRYLFDVVLRRQQGPESLWVTTSRALIGELRKQFLAWRALPPAEKEKYVKKGATAGLR